jgi:hypothetical protein
VHKKMCVHRRVSVYVAMLRLSPVTNLELFEYQSPDQSRSLPNNDYGDHHLAFYVEAQLGAEVVGDPEGIEEGPIVWATVGLLLTLENANRGLVRATGHVVRAAEHRPPFWPA